MAEAKCALQRCNEKRSGRTEISCHIRLEKATNLSEGEWGKHRQRPIEEEAFSTINHGILLDCLSRQGWGGTILQLFWSYLEEVDAGKLLLSPLAFGLWAPQCSILWH